MEIFSHRYSLGIPARLTLMALVTALPLVAVASFAILRTVDDQRAQIQSDVRQMVESFLANVDRELSAIQAELQVLATSPSLQTGDFRAFYQQMRAALSIRGTSIVLHDTKGQQLLSTNLPFGEPLPRATNTEMQDRVVATGKPQISDLIMGAVLKRPILMVGVPVFHDGEVVWVLAMGLGPEGLSALMREERLSPDWTAAILDRKGVIAARNRDLDRFLGQLVAPMLREKLADSVENWIPNVTSDGIPVYSTFRRSTMTGWTVAIGLPREYVDAPLWRARLIAFGGGTAILALTLAFLTQLRAGTAELGRSVDELTMLSEVGQAVSSTLNLTAVLSTILTRSVGLAGADAGAIFRYNRAERSFRLVEAIGWDEALARSVGNLPIVESETAMGEAAARRAPIQIADLAQRPSAPLRDVILAAGFRGVLIIPLVGPERILGALVLQRRAAGEFPPETLRLMQTLASQSVLAIRNARLFREIADKSEQLALASEHKSQFLANMSHELRTPLNAILGYAELLVDGVYGQLPDRPRGVLARIQNNGKHLLALINDVLDLAKIEAGQLTLTIEGYSLPEVVKSVVTAAEPLATSKGLKFTAALQSDMPTAHGDARRVSQVLLNLVGNAIKFTDEGQVEIRAAADRGQFILTVRDTGPGIAEADQERIFGEFQQIDDTNTRKKGGTGLGLAISKRMVEMQGGTISVESVLGQGSTFRVVLPVYLDEVLGEAA